jgi:hypothetical protein
VIHEDVRDKLVEDCAVFSHENGPADGILVIGDTAYSGTTPEYTTAATWLKLVSQAGGSPSHAVRTIPGNHDIDRSRISLYGKNAHTAIRQASLEHLDGCDQASAWISGGFR